MKKIIIILLLLNLNYICAMKKYIRRYAPLFSGGPDKTGMPGRDSLSYQIILDNGVNAFVYPKEKVAKVYKYDPFRTIIIPVSDNLIDALNKYDSSEELYGSLIKDDEGNKKICLRGHADC